MRTTRSSASAGISDRSSAAATSSTVTLPRSLPLITSSATWSTDGPLGNTDAPTGHSLRYKDKKMADLFLAPKVRRPYLCDRYLANVWLVLDQESIVIHAPAARS